MRETLSEQNVRKLESLTGQTLNYFDFRKEVESYLEYLKKEGREHLLIEIKKFVDKKVESLLKE